MASSSVLLSLPTLAATIRQSIEDNLAALKLHLAVALPDGDAGVPPLGELVSRDRASSALLMLGNNVAQAVVSAVANLAALEAAPSVVATAAAEPALACSRCGQQVQLSWDHLSIGEHGERWTCMPVLASPAAEAAARAEHGDGDGSLPPAVNAGEPAARVAARTRADIERITPVGSCWKCGGGVESWELGCFGCGGPPPSRRPLFDESAVVQANADTRPFSSDLRVKP